MIEGPGGTLLFESLADSRVQHAVTTRAMGDLKSEAGAGGSRARSASRPARS